MSVEFLIEQSGFVELYCALSEGSRALAYTQTAETAHTNPLGTTSSGRPAFLGPKCVDQSIDESPAPDRTAFGARPLGSRAPDNSAQGVDPWDTQELYRLAVETCPNGLVIVDPLGTIMMVNGSVERMFGYERNALLGQSVDVLVPERLRPLHAARCGSSRTHGGIIPMNIGEILLGRRVDSSEFPIEVTINLTHAGGDLFVLSPVADSNKQRDAEKHLEQMEVRYRGLLEAAPDAMVVVNASGEIVLLNIQAERSFGYRRDELVGQNVTNIIPEGFAERLIADALRSTEDALAQHIGVGAELSGLRKDGSAFPIEIMLSPLESTDGILVTAAIRDITTRRRVERLKDEFVSTVSHELRTPLTSIAGALGLLAGNAGGKLPDPAARLVAIAYANSQRLARLINDILDMEKLEFGQVVFRFSRLNVRSLVEQAIEVTRGFAEGYGVRVRLTDMLDSYTVRVDGDRLLQVVTNLLSNAVKFSPVGEEVTLTIGPRGNTVRISVRDRGPGIPSNFRPHVFDKFAQADATDARQKGGTGLGLSIVKQITTRLGGEVGFEDAPGGGTTFYVEFPSVDHTADRGADSDEGSDVGPMLVLSGDESTTIFAATQSAVGRPAILHVDDDADALRLVVEVMASSVDLVSVGSISEARLKLKEKNFALAVIDLALDGESGLDLLPYLYDRENHAIPVIVFSVRCADLECDAQIKMKFDKSKTSIDRLLPCVLDYLAPLPVRATGETR